MSSRLVSAVVFVSALGYFVDMYDLLLFNIVRVKSLSDLGVAPELSAAQGLKLLNFQMAGMLIGGLIFGVMGDRLGRMRALFASIFLYSIATLLNAFVQNIDQYAVLRLIAGIGLAGELGCGVTLACESISQKNRGLGPMLIASIGFLGAIFAFFVSELTTWRNAYCIGGALGMSLLILRVRVSESSLFEKVRAETTIKRGDLRRLLGSRKLLGRLALMTGLGIPIWFIGGILVALSPEFGRTFQIEEPISAGRAILFLYSGTIVGDIASGFMSQWMQSRKKALLVFISFCAASIGCFLSGVISSTTEFYIVVFAMGFATGYWALLITVAAEQFGTNFRATAATSVPNFIRGSLIPISAAFLALRAHEFSMVSAAACVGLAALTVSFFSVLMIEETFSKDLDFID